MTAQTEQEETPQRHDPPARGGASDGGATFAEAGEQGVIAAIRRHAPSPHNGDDAAVLVQAAPNSRVVVTTDLLVEGRHFRRDWATSRDVGHKAIIQNFADIEAMGARPVAAVLGLSAPPETPLSFAEGLAKGLSEAMQQFNAELVGGDLTAGREIVVAITAVGALGGNRPALRLDRARAGSALAAHGVIGYSRAGLEVLRRFGRDFPEELAPLVQAHLRPHIEAGRGVVARATGADAMTDNSDGLIVDLRAIARASGVHIDIAAADIAPDALLQRAGELLGADPWEWVLTGGEDHTLLAATRAAIPSGFRRIGTVRGASASHPAGSVTVNGDRPAYCTGWESF